MPDPQCDQFDMLNPEGRRWSCMHSGIGGAGALLVGCGMHCMPCDAAEQAGVAGHNVRGRRWLRPHPGLYTGSGNYRPLESRDGRGNYNALRSGYPWDTARWMQVLSWLQLASCWQQCSGTCTPGYMVGSLELFDQASVDDPYTICDCGAGDNECGVYSACTLCGLLTTCHLFHTNRWPPRGSRLPQFECTGAISHNEPLECCVAPGSFFFGPGLITTGSGEHRQARNNCSHNMGAQCWGHQVPDSLGCYDVGWAADDYYNHEVNNAWTAFDYLWLQSIGPTADDPHNGAYFAGDSPEAELMNKALAWLQEDLDRANEGQPTVSGIGHLDSNRRYSSPGDPTVNDGLTRFAFSWGHELPGPDIATRPKVADLTCRLVHTGIEFAADYVISTIDVRASLVAYRVNERIPGGPTGDPIYESFIRNATYPLIRFEIILQMAVRPDLSQFPVYPLVKTWRHPDEQGDPLTLHVIHEYPHALYPRVLGGPSYYPDHIEYVYNGQPIAVRDRIRWYGEESFLSDPATYDVYAHQTNTTAYKCCRFKRGFNGGYFSGDWPPPGHPVRGASSHIDADPEERHLVWDGSVILTIGTSNVPC